MKYLELATSKDSSRYNLQSIYRDKTCMVATDGHRLHLVGNLPAVEKGHSLDGKDIEFPAYEQVLPKSAPISEVEIHLDKTKLDKLNALLKFVQTNDKKWNSIELVATQTHGLGSGPILLIQNPYGCKIGFSMSLDAVSVTNVTRIKMNLKYFIDSLHGIDRVGERVTIKFYDNPMITVDRIGDKKAVIMGMKQD